MNTQDALEATSDLIKLSTGAHNVFVNADHVAVQIHYNVHAVGDVEPEEYKGLNVAIHPNSSELLRAVSAEKRDRSWFSEHPRANVPVALYADKRFEDHSWSNDTCPRFVFNPDRIDDLTNVRSHLVLVCDYADPADREEGSEFRYTVEGWDPDGEYVNTLYEGDDLANAIGSCEQLEADAEYAPAPEPTPASNPFAPSQYQDGDENPSGWGVWFDNGTEYDWAYDDSDLGEARAKTLADFLNAHYVHLDHVPASVIANLINSTQGE